MWQVNELMWNISILANLVKPPVSTIFPVSQRIGEENKVGKVGGQVGRN